MDTGPVGRDEELSRLHRFLDGIADGPTGLVIEGSAGIGKTTLWQACADSATHRRWRVLVARPAEVETKLSFAGLHDLFDGLDGELIGALPDPQRLALETALLRRTADESADRSSHSDAGFHAKLNPVLCDAVDCRLAEAWIGHVYDFRVHAGLYGIENIPPGEVNRGRSLP